MKIAAGIIIASNECVTGCTNNTLPMPDGAEFDQFSHSTLIHFSNGAIIGYTN